MTKHIKQYYENITSSLTNYKFHSRLFGGFAEGRVIVAGSESINLNTNKLLFTQECIKCCDMLVKPNSYLKR